MLHISSVRFLHSSNTRYNDIKLHLEKEVECTKKRFLQQRSGRKHSLVQKDTTKAS